MVGDFLAGMAAAAGQRARETLAVESLEALRARALATPAPEPLQAHPSGFDLIAEIKLRAPSAGSLASPDTDIAQRARAYAAAGAMAISVLTEPTRFDGSLEHLGCAALAVRGSGVPVMRKDFLVHPCQVWEARAAGAGGVLLILPILDDPTLTEMLATAREAGLFVLLEAFDSTDLERCHSLTKQPGLLLGLNCRNLRNLEIEPERFARLADRFPDGPPRVAESGLACPEDVAGVAGLGYDCALVGSALMQAADPSAELAAFLAAGRELRV